MKHFTNIDLLGNEIQNAVIHSLSSSPLSPKEGQVYFDSNIGNKKIYFYNGSQWVVLEDTNNYTSGISFLSGILTLNRNGLSDLTVNLDGRYATFQYVDDSLLNVMHLSGNETFTGIKTSINSSFGNGLNLENGLSATTSVLNLTNNSVGASASFVNNSTHSAAYFINAGSGSGIRLLNTFPSTGKFISAFKTTTEVMYLDNVGNMMAKSFIKSGGTSSQFLKADGSIDSNIYLLSSDNHWTKTGNNILNNNTGIVILRGGAGGIYDTVLRTQYLNGATWMDSNFRVDNGGNVEASNVTVYGGVLLPANGGFLACDGDGTNYIKGYRDDRWVSDIKFKYLTDLSATYDDRTLIDKGYLDSRITILSGFVPYTGATSNVNLGEYQITAGQYIFDQTPTQSAGVAVLRWNDTDGTLDLGLKGGNVTLQLGQEQLVRIVNKTLSNLTEAGYQAVYTSGAQGQRLKVDLALANSDLTSAGTLGIVTENIDVNQEGFVTTNGLVRGINTTGSLQGETWSDGDILYLSPTIAGRLTNIKPVSPQHLVVIGVCVYAHITQGSIFVKVDNGYELDELHNVLISSLANNDILVYETASTLWKNKTISSALGYTPANDSNVVHLSGTEIITGFKTFNPSISASSAIARGTYLTPSLTATANNDVLVGLDINPTFTNGAFTGVSNYSVRVNGSVKVTSSVQVGDNALTASSVNVGAIRYRNDANNSYMDMVMQTGASTYAWVNVVQNTW